QGQEGTHGVPARATGRPVLLAGRPLEPVGDGRPRWMVATRSTPSGTGSGLHANSSARYAPYRAEHCETVRLVGGDLPEMQEASGPLARDGAAPFQWFRVPDAGGGGADRIMESGLGVVTMQ